jgi:hypothetical protein
MLGVHTITTAKPPAPAPAPAHQVPSAPIAPVASSQASSAPPFTVPTHPVYVNSRQTTSADPRESDRSSAHRTPSRRVGPVSALKGMFASHVVSNGFQRYRAKVQSHKPIEVEIVPTPTVTRSDTTRANEATLASDIGIVANRSDSSRQDDHQRHAARSSHGIHSITSTRTQTKPRDQSEITSSVIPDEPPSAISLRRWLTRSDDSRVNYNPPVKVGTISIPADVILTRSRPKRLEKSPPLPLGNNVLAHLRPLQRLRSPLTKSNRHHTPLVRPRHPLRPGPGMSTWSLRPQATTRQESAHPSFTDHLDSRVWTSTCLPVPNPVLDED